VRDGGGGELVDDGRVTREEVERQGHRDGRGGHGGEDDEGGSLKEEELGGVGAAVERDLRRGGIVDGERGGPRDAAVIEAELDEEEQQHAEGGTHGGDVDEVLDAAVPRLRGAKVSCTHTEDAVSGSSARQACSVAVCSSDSNPPQRGGA
jgi:hypothetical protein